MGLAVEPPDVNASEWDFAIEDRDDGTSVIRFGLGAVKNVGQSPVDAILEARGSQPFTDLNDIARRVDLRHVGKRALESLTRVGALDCFGPRTAILEALDRIIAVSTSHFRAAEMGQMSLFGEHTGLEEEIALPAATMEISRREILNWERELIGLYVSDHPLSPVMKELNDAVTHFSAQLSEAGPNEHVRVAGLIIRIRHHQSKAGKPMGFVTLEDLQGAIELVIFPRVWAKFSDLIDYDRIILVEGRLDTEGAEPKVLVDNITTEFTTVNPLNERPLERSTQNPASQTAWSAGKSRDAGSTRPNELESSSDNLQPAHKVSERIDEDPERKPVPDSSDFNEWESDSPPPPDIFPPGWESYDQVLTIPESRLQENPQVVPAPSTETQPVMTQVEFSVHAGAPTVVLAVAPESEESVISRPALPAAPPSAEIKNEPEGLRASALPLYLVSPATKTEDYDGTVYMLTVVLRSTGDKTRDVLRLRRMHGIITSYPGNDRFAFHLFERGRGYLLEFPNFTAGVCPELMSRLTALIGLENVRVEPITFQ